ncbi:RF-1 domain peptide chain release factor [Acinetobacter phage Acj9]|uniref:Conserved hypothetical bacterial protein n=1 Tax=Acinetobacter phage Acj9 TaxID=760939 RepID=E5EPS9_9CAUD|nr:RF-1 domain peptide chain release factor [Acinetobacter phage Acj9]ADG60045.1 conserved hypothetical bacterial protein [Acinetobacter phage Acj9]
MFNPSELRIDTWCSKQTTWGPLRVDDTCRLTHLPTGLHVEFTERSIYKAKAKCFEALEELVATHHLEFYTPSDLIQ